MSSASRIVTPSLVVPLLLVFVFVFFYVDFLHCSCDSKGCSLGNEAAGKVQNIAGRASLEDYDSNGDGYGPEYDFYRKHGEVPSPGMGN